jgi:hypothetical protein
VLSLSLALNLQPLIGFQVPKVYCSQIFLWLAGTNSRVNPFTINLGLILF